MQKFYLLFGKEQKGPYSEEEVREMYVAGTITPETLHRTDDLADWQALGPRDNRTGEPRPAPMTIAPPRRSQQSGKYLIERKPTDPDEKPLDADHLSLRTKPITLIKAAGLLLLFFLLLTVLLELVSHTMPDAAKRFAAIVEQTSQQK